MHFKIHTNCPIIDTKQTQMHLILNLRLHSQCQQKWPNSFLLLCDSDPIFSSEECESHTESLLNPDLGHFHMWSSIKYCSDSFFTMRPQSEHIRHIGCDFHDFWVVVF